MKRIAVIFGTRPEAIKMAPIVRALEQHSQLEPVIILTAQHREMVDQAMEVFGLQPTVDLDLMQPGQTLSDLTGRMIQQLGPVLRDTRPDAVLVQGDTTSTFCGALSAFYEQIPVGHVEAGLRTGDLRSPFPEELNRVVTTRMANWHFAATAKNAENLRAEGVGPQQIHVTGNTVIDALYWIRDRFAKGERTAGTSDLLGSLPRPFALITGHRRESFGGGFQRICEAIAQLAVAHPELDWVYPVHLNPQVQAPVRERLGGIANIRLLPPLGYEAFVAVMCQAHLILTDSGGVQEEAPALGKPTFVLRDKTERLEGIGGAIELVGTQTEQIVAAVDRLLNDPVEYRRRAAAGSPYGIGTAARQIVEILAQELCGSRIANPSRPAPAKAA